VELIKGKPIGKHVDDLGNPDTRSSAIPGQHLSALISMGYIFGFRKDNAIFFNGLGQNYPDRVSPKRLCH
jgi:hypothetical protein